MKMVFWLMLVSDGGYNYGTTEVHRVPYAMEEDCNKAAVALTALRTVEAYCFGQPLSDVQQYIEGLGGNRWFNR